MRRRTPSNRQGRPQRRRRATLLHVGGVGVGMDYSVVWDIAPGLETKYLMVQGHHVTVVAMLALTRQPGFARHVSQAWRVPFFEIEAQRARAPAYGYCRVWAMVNRTFRRLQPQAPSGVMRMQDSDAAAAPASWPTASRPGAAASVESSLVLGHLPDSVLEWRGPLGCLRDRLPRPEVFPWTASPRPLNGGDIRTLMDKALWARFGEATLRAPHAIQWLSDNRPPVHGAGVGALRARAGANADHDAGAQPGEQRPRRRLCTHLSNATR
jgi:hypothetical protein